MREESKLQKCDGGDALFAAKIILNTGYMIALFYMLYETVESGALFILYSILTLFSITIGTLCSIIVFFLFAWICLMIFKKPV